MLKYENVKIRKKLNDSYNDYYKLLEELHFHIGTRYVSFGQNSSGTAIILLNLDGLVHELPYDANVFEYI